MQSIDLINSGIYYMQLESIKVTLIIHWTYNGKWKYMVDVSTKCYFNDENCETNITVDIQHI